MVDDHLSQFSRTYEAQVLGELPTTSARTFYFPGASESGGKAGLLVLVSPHDRPRWLGVFASGSGAGALSALSSTPAANKLLVISRGAGYFVDSNDPKQSTELPEIYPITTIRPLPDLGIIVLADHTTVAAVGASGRVWRTRRLSFDGIVIKHIRDHYLEGEAWDPTSPIRPKFQVDLWTGEHKGGACPETYEK